MHSQIICLLSLTVALLTCSLPTAFCQKNKVEKVEATCKGLPRDQRPRITVASFDITRSRAQGVVGSELASMLANALGQTECFNVLESISKVHGAMEEVKFNQTGATDGSGPEAGKMKGAQLIISGDVTEYVEEKLHVLGVGSNKAHIGFILKITDPQTREVLWSESINKKITKAEVKVFNTDIAKFGSQAMEDAVEKAILEAVSLIVGQKELISDYKPQVQADQAPKYDRTTCPSTMLGNGPTVMVIIPEVHITRRVPDPAGETAIIKTLISAGFKVLDPSVYKSIRESEELRLAVQNQDAAAASRIGARFKADIIIFGEAFSESTGTQNGMQTCRARVEARAVSTRNAQILGADGKHAGGLDNSELVASKAALRNAGTEMGTYFVNTLCEAKIPGGSSNEGMSVSEISLSHATFSSAGKVETYIKTFKQVKSVKKTLEGGVARFEVQHTGDLTEIANGLDQKRAGMVIEITGAEGNRLEGKIQ